MTKEKGSTATPAEAQAPEAGMNDSIAINRTVRFLQRSEVGDVPAHYVPTDPDTRRKSLRYVEQALYAELGAGLLQVAEVGTVQVKADLGDVPDAAKAKAIADRMIGIETTLEALQQQVACHEELLSIVVNDGIIFLDRMNEEITHFAPRKPQLANRYSKVLKFYSQLGAKISDGRARAKAEAAATAEAVAKAQAKPDVK